MGSPVRLNSQAHGWGFSPVSKQRCNKLASLPFWRDRPRARTDDSGKFVHWARASSRKFGPIVSLTVLFAPFGLCALSQPLGGNDEYIEWYVPAAIAWVAALVLIGV